MLDYQNIIRVIHWTRATAFFRNILFQVKGYSFLWSKRPNRWR